MNVEGYKRAVVVSKNPGGTKRVTSLADALKLNFGIVMTDRQRLGNGVDSMMQSAILDPIMPRGLDGNFGSITAQGEEYRVGPAPHMPRLKIPAAGQGQRPSPLHHSFMLDKDNYPAEYTEAPSSVPSAPSTVRGDDDDQAGDEAGGDEEADDGGSDSGDEGDFDPVSSRIV